MVALRAARHIKCDEGKPICKKCSAGQLKCTYVDSPRKGKGKSNSELQTPSEASSPPLPSPGHALNLMELSGDDATCFDFFRNVMIPKLSGFFEAEFFQHTVLQLSFSEPAIWHALLAITSFALPKEYFEPDRKGKQTFPVFSRRFALDHYNKAVERLHGTMSQGELPVEVILTACLSFSILEIAFKNIQGAITHLQAGLRVLYSWKANHGEQNVTIDTYLTPIFEDFMIRAITYGWTNLSTEKHTYQPELERQAYFSNVREARISLLQIQRFGLEAARTFEMHKVDQSLGALTAGSSEEQRSQFVDSLQQWSQNFEKLLSTLRISQLDAKEVYAINTLRFQQKLAAIYIPYKFDNDETKFDSHVQDFEDALETAEFLCSSTNGTASEGESCQDLMFVGMHCPQVFVIITKCRNPVLRRRGLVLLKALPRGEDIRARTVVPEVAERVIAIEEEGLEGLRDAKGLVVPSDWARVHDINVISELAGDPKRCVVQFRLKGRDGVWYHREDEFVL
ncbi:hypothetical protein G7Y89_g11763 [Cudoniella acicularis]|uniref:Zn(2)-C6 fungal-type domain-containing protein n=1 Tax=Cudoniella acicularis TaxID=354080 RepID=A0A8H4VZV1_9HELO|nr:hypothetical protein G7Y89_g11763 [Cudoniella acicularis]